MHKFIVQTELGDIPLAILDASSSTDMEALTSGWSEPMLQRRVERPGGMELIEDAGGYALSLAPGSSHRLYIGKGSMEQLHARMELSPAAVLIPDGTQLYTKDGRKNSNAIVLMELRPNVVGLWPSGERQVERSWQVETDFGNIGSYTLQELMERWYVGETEGSPPRGYEEWAAARLKNIFTCLSRIPPVDVVMGRDEHGQPLQVTGRELRDGRMTLFAEHPSVPAVEGEVAIRRLSVDGGGFKAIPMDAEDTSSNRHFDINTGTNEGRRAWGRIIAGSSSAHVRQDGDLSITELPGMGRAVCGFGAMILFESYIPSQEFLELIRVAECPDVPRQCPFCNGSNLAIVSDETWTFENEGSLRGSRHEHLTEYKCLDGCDGRRFFV